MRLPWYLGGEGLLTPSSLLLHCPPCHKATSHLGTTAQPPLCWPWLLRAKSRERRYQTAQRTASTHHWEVPLLLTSL